MNALTLETLPTAALVALYNTEAPKPVKKFENREIALKRLSAMAGDRIVVRDEAGEVRFETTNGAAPEAAEAAPAIEATEAPAEVVEAAPEAPTLSGEALEHALAAAAGEFPIEDERVEETDEDEAPAPSPEAVAATSAAIEKIVAAANAAEKTGRRGPKPTYADDDVITIKSGKNPKRPGTAACARFALYIDGMTVTEYLAACVALQGGKTGDYRSDLTWDDTRGFIGFYTARQMRNSNAGRDIEDDGPGA